MSYHRLALLQHSSVRQEGVKEAVNDIFHFLLFSTTGPSLPLAAEEARFRDALLVGTLLTGVIGVVAGLDVTDGVDKGCCVDDDFLTRRLNPEADFLTGFAFGSMGVSFTSIASI